MHQEGEADGINFQIGQGSFVVCCLVALVSADPGYFGHVTPLAYNSIVSTPVAYSAIVAPGAVTSQYHTQDTLGQYAYGYQGDTSAKHEVRTADGITQGAYSYLDAHGLVQSARYVSDPLNGFRVAATNDPSLAASAGHTVVAAGTPVGVADTVEVAAAKAAHFNAHVAAKAALLGRKKRSPGYAYSVSPAVVGISPAASFGYSAVAAYPSSVTVSHSATPAVVAAAPAESFGYSAVAAHPSSVVVSHSATPGVVAAAPGTTFGYSGVASYPSSVTVSHAAPVATLGYSAVAHPTVVSHASPAVAVTYNAVNSQHHAQDVLGQYSYGYADANSAKHETRAVDGSTNGAYSYVDGHGLVQSVRYHADSLGFRVAATNLPVGPA